MDCPEVVHDRLSASGDVTTSCSHTSPARSTAEPESITVDARPRLEFGSMNDRLALRRLRLTTFSMTDNVTVFLGSIDGASVRGEGADLAEALRHLADRLGAHEEAPFEVVPRPRWQAGTSGAVAIGLLLLTQDEPEDGEVWNAWWFAADGHIWMQETLPAMLSEDARSGHFQARHQEYTGLVCSVAEVTEDSLKDVRTSPVFVLTDDASHPWVRQKALALADVAPVETVERDDWPAPPRMQSREQRWRRYMDDAAALLNLD
jgi:hypothetical protein